MQGFIFARDTDTLRSNTELLFKALGSGITFEQAQKYRTNHIGTSAQEILNKRDFGLYVVCHTMNDTGDFSDVLEHIIMKEEERGMTQMPHVIVVSGLPLEDYKQYGLTMINRPDGNLQNPDKGVIYDQYVKIDD